MVQYFRAFVALALLSPMISLPALAGVSLLAEDPKYRECMNHDTGCAKYLNITSVCTQLAKDGNFTVDPVKFHKNLLKCNCPDPQYLPGLKVCDKCTGQDEYSPAAAECDAFMGGQNPPTALPTSTKTKAVQTPLAKTSTTANETTSMTTSTSTSGTSAPSASNTPSPANALHISLKENLPMVLAASIFGIAAGLAGVM